MARSKLQPNWLRLSEDQVFYHRSLDHGDRFVLSIAFRFSTYDNEHQFALFYPYAYTNLNSFIWRWKVEQERVKTRKSNSDTSASKNRGLTPELFDRSKRFHHDSHTRSKSSQGFRRSEESESNSKSGDDLNFKVKTLGTTILSKSIYLLTIKGTRDVSKPRVLVICRQSGNLDSAASLVCQGLIDYILSDNPLAKTARQHMDLIAFPMIDPDSVWAGNSDTDIMGQASVSSKTLQKNGSLYANLVSIHETLKQACCSKYSNRVILLELRVNLNLIGSRVVGSYFKDSLRMERHIALPRLIARFANDFYLENCQFLKSTKLSSLIDCSNQPEVDQYKLEVSPFAFYKRSLVEHQYEEYDQLGYLKLGKALIYSLLELLRTKDKYSPHCVTETLNSFHRGADDIDDLLLEPKDNKSG